MREKMMKGGGGKEVMGGERRKISPESMLFRDCSVVVAATQTATTSLFISSRTRRPSSTNLTFVAQRRPQEAQPP